jgi:hypothetical protein
MKMRDTYIFLVAITGFPTPQFSRFALLLLLLFRSLGAARTSFSFNVNSLHSPPPKGVTQTELVGLF